jgi:glutathione S-transferase
MFRDNDGEATEVNGVSAILHYVDRYHSFCADKPVTAASYALLELLSQTPGLVPGSSAMSEPSVSATNALDLSATLYTVCERLKGHGGPFIAGKRFSVADCVIWPALDDLIKSWDSSKELPWPELAEYYRLAWKKKACLKKLRAELPSKM